MRMSFKRLCMTSKQATSIALRFILVGGLTLKASLAASQEPPISHPSHLAADVCTRLAEAAQNSALAPWQREFMLEVAHDGGTGVASRMTGTAAEDGVWAPIPPPSSRSSHTAIYDPVRDRMVVFGGAEDMWVLSLSGSPTWSRFAPAGSQPPARSGHTAIYDPVRDRMVVFGGSGSGSRLRDVWVLSLSGIPSWSLLVPLGSPPAAREWHTALYDPVRDRMLVFGGTSGFNDVWALPLTDSPTWSHIAPSGSPPMGRWSHSAIYDPVRDRMVVFGGTSGFSSFNDVWALSLAGSPAWSLLAPAGVPPSARMLHTAIYDPVRDRMVVFGGFDGLNDASALSLSGDTQWIPLNPAGIPPEGRYGHAAIYDPVRDRMVVFGGASNSVSGGAILTKPFNDVWALSLFASPVWSALDPAGAQPSVRAGHTAIYDPVRDRMVVFAGSDQSSYFNDVWALSLSGNPTWSALAPAGNPPPARSAHTAIYDPVRDRMVVFGGFTLSDPFSPPTAYNDVRALSLSGGPTWSLIAAGGSPPTARFGHTAIYDPVRDRMVVFGGTSGTGSYFDDVIVLSLSGDPTWSEIAPKGSPPIGRQAHTATYDPVRDRMVVFGGGSLFGHFNDVWALSLGSPAWSALAPAGSLPASRSGQTAIYDPVRERMVVFGGGGAGVFNDVWALSLAGSPAWSMLAPTGSLPSARSAHTATYDPVRDRMVVFGGLYQRHRNDVSALWWAPLVSVPGVADVGTRRFELSSPRPNPSRGETIVDFELWEPARVVLDVLDLHGRRVKRIADAWFTAGRYAGTWRGDDDRGQAMRSGVYFIRMQGAGFQTMRRAVRIR